MKNIVNRINDPKDLRELTIPELVQTSQEIRKLLVNTVSQNGGHLAPSLGAVELTLALHYVFDTPKDKLVWDVGHQAYVHKIITGRRDRFHTIRQYKGLSGFIKPDESIYDTFAVGHASTAISAGLGMATARDLAGEKYKVVSIVGDGALTGGLAFEGMNNAGGLNTDFIVILNDNEMSISPNVGAIARYLTNILTNPIYNRIKQDIWELTGRMATIGQHIRDVVRRIDEGVKAILVPGQLFEHLGFRYIGPINGHHLALLVRYLREVKKMNGPILVHVLTKKGKGYRFAEEDATRFHGLGAFDPQTGTSSLESPIPGYTDVFGKTVVDIANINQKVVGITAAMAVGTGLIHLAKTHPARFFDVGIAEGHAVTFAAGMAIRGYRPIVAIYSSFLQRSYDQVIHDIALQKLPVIFAIDRAGLVGQDGPTHHGVFDLTYLRSIPNMVIMAPKDENELRQMLWTAVQYEKGPIAIRYPRAPGSGVPIQEKMQELAIGKSQVMRGGNDIAILAVGTMVNTALAVADILEKEHLSIKIVNVRFVKPMDTELLETIFRDFKIVATLEENTLIGGFGSAVAEFIFDHAITNVELLRFGIPDRFIEHGDTGILLSEIGLTPEKIANKLKIAFPSQQVPQLAKLQELIALS